MIGNNVNFGNKKSKKVTKIDDINVNEISVSKEEPNGTKNLFKYFIGCNDNDVIRPLCTKLPQITGYVRKFDCITTMSFRISDKQLLKDITKYGKKLKDY